MKKIQVIVVITLCLLSLALPVIAAPDGKGDRDGQQVGASGDNGRPPGEKNDRDGNGGNGTPGADRGKSPPDQQNAKDRNVTPQDKPRTEPGLKNQSEDRGAPKNESSVPPGWERNPNLVRDAVHELLAMENRTGGIGPQVSAIAREFNNSANASRQYEDRIQNRDPFTRFFIGSDRQAAAGLAALAAQNQVRINEIENLLKTANLDADTRFRIEEQLQLLQQQVAFEQQLAVQAERDRGIFGWLL